MKPAKHPTTGLAVEYSAMSAPRRLPLNRRQFLQSAGSLGALAVGHAATREISIVVDPADPVANAKPAQWAIKEFEDSLPLAV